MGQLSEVFRVFTVLYNGCPTVFRVITLCVCVVGGGGGGHLSEVFGVVMVCVSCCPTRRCLKCSG